MADQNDINRTRQGKDAWNAWAAEELKKPRDQRTGVDFSGEPLPVIYFSGFVFPGRANFAGATFNDEANFKGATFNGQVHFEGAAFNREAHFEGATFRRYTHFKDATFESSANFNNATFEDTAIFTHATFKIAPTFHNAGIHQDTEFSSGDKFFKQFPDIESDHSERAYRTLKLVMNKYQSHTEEAGFFKLELQARAKKEKRYRKWMYDAYGLFSDYGQSVSRPLYWWAGLGVAMFFLYFSISGEFDAAATVTMGQALPLIGAEKNAYYDALEIISQNGPPVLFQITRALHMLVSYALIFLSLLALRNRFKIK